MEEQFIALLLRDGGVQSAVEDRIWPLNAPQKSGRPYIIVQTASTVPGYTVQGEDGLTEVRLQVDAYADDYRRAKLTIRMVRQAVSGRRIGIFRGIFAQTERDLSEQNSVMTSADKVYRVSQDFIIHHTGV